MPPQHSVDKAARRRWLARRRSIRALRRTLTFIVLVTPFCYFGLVLCCHMPVHWRYALPNWILLYEFWMFFSNTYVLVRYIRFAPLWAPIPFVITVAFSIFYPPGPHYRINHDTYFDFFTMIV